MYDFICGFLNVKSNRYDEANSIASDKYKWKWQTLRIALGKKQLTEDMNLLIVCQIGEKRNEQSNGINFNKK